MARDLSGIFEGAVFHAPEGLLTAHPQRVEEDEDDRLKVLLWFHDGDGMPVEAHVTVRLAAGETGNPAYRDRVHAAVQQWLTGIRDGEPLVDVSV